METTKKYQIVLPKGEAPRPFFELNEEERLEISLKILKHVTARAAEVGSLPVISKDVVKAVSNT